MNALAKKREAFTDNLSDKKVNQFYDAHVLDKDARREENRAAIIILENFSLGPSKRCLAPHRLLKQLSLILSSYAEEKFATFTQLTKFFY